MPLESRVNKRSLSALSYTALSLSPRACSSKSASCHALATVSMSSNVVTPSSISSGPRPHHIGPRECPWKITAIVIDSKRSLSSGGSSQHHKSDCRARIANESNRFCVHVPRSVDGSGLRTAPDASMSSSSKSPIRKLVRMRSKPPYGLTMTAASASLPQAATIIAK